MAALMESCVRMVANRLWPPSLPVQAVKRQFTDWRTIRDQKRRNTCIEYGALRCRLNCIRKNRILPKAIRELADAEIDVLPRDSATHRVKGRCVVTSRGRGVFSRWRLSRIVFRRLCDFNHMSGAQRATW